MSRDYKTLIRLRKESIRSADDFAERLLKELNKIKTLRQEKFYLFRQNPNNDKEYVPIIEYYMNLAMYYVHESIDKSIQLNTLE